MKLWHAVWFIIMMWAVTSCVHSGMEVIFKLGTIQGSLKCSPN